MGSSSRDTGWAHGKSQLRQVGFSWDTSLGFLSMLRNRGAFLSVVTAEILPCCPPVPGHPPSKHKSVTLAPNHEHLTIESHCHQEKLIELFIVDLHVKNPIAAEVGAEESPGMENKPSPYNSISESVRFSLWVSVLQIY